MRSTFYTIAYTIWEALKTADPLGWTMHEQDNNGRIIATVDWHSYEISARRVD